MCVCARWHHLPRLPLSVREAPPTTAINEDDGGDEEGDDEGDDEDEEEEDEEEEEDDEEEDDENREFYICMFYTLSPIAFPTFGSIWSRPPTPEAQPIEEHFLTFGPFAGDTLMQLFKTYPGYVAMAELCGSDSRVKLVLSTLKSEGLLDVIWTEKLSLYLSCWQTFDSDYIGWINSHHVFEYNS